MGTANNCEKIKGVDTCLCGRDPECDRAGEKPKSSKIVFEQGYPIPAEKKPKLPFRTVLRRHDPILVHARKAARALR